MITLLGVMKDFRHESVLWVIFLLCNFLLSSCSGSEEANPYVPIKDITKRIDVYAVSVLPPV